MEEEVAVVVLVGCVRYVFSSWGSGGTMILFVKVVVVEGAVLVVAINVVLVVESKKQLCTELFVIADM